MFGYSIKQAVIAVGVGITLVVLGFFIGDSPEEKAISISPSSTVATHASEAAPPLTSPQTPPAGEAAALKITFVVDGDTVELSTGQRVRLIGIDAPESGSVYYSEARDRLAQLILNKEVRLEKDVTETDRYGRLLRYIYVGQTFVNLELVRSGYAVSYKYPPDVKYQEQFVAAEQESRMAKVGLWKPQPMVTTPAVVPSSSTPATQTPPPGSATPVTAVYSVPPCASSDCDCGHFSTHNYAQWFHDNYDLGDKHRLDNDKDGLACESLP